MNTPSYHMDIDHIDWNVLKIVFLHAVFGVSFERYFFEKNCKSIAWVKLLSFIFLWCIRKEWCCYQYSSVKNCIFACSLSIFWMIYLWKELYKVLHGWSCCLLYFYGVQYISLLFIGILVVISVRGFLTNLMKVISVFPVLLLEIYLALLGHEVFEERYLQGFCIFFFFVLLLDKWINNGRQRILEEGQVWGPHLMDYLNYEWL